MKMFQELHGWRTEQNTDKLGDRCLTLLLSSSLLFIFIVIIAAYHKISCQSAGVKPY
jgi:hypothetical protein